MIIYKVTNLMNNKCYIGYTTKSLDERRRQHYKRMKYGRNFYFHNALKKYKPTNFKWEILGFCYSLKELKDSEIECISFFNSNNRIYGYNLTKGGDGAKGTKRSLKTKEKLRKINLGKKYSKETNKKKGKSKYGKDNPMYGRRGELSPSFGRKKSKKEKEKISKILKNGKLCSGEKNGNAKTYKITFINNTFIVIRSLRTWCEDKDISESTLRKILRSNGTFSYKNILKVEKIKCQ